MKYSLFLTAALALALLLSGCSREPVNAAPAMAPATIVESVPDRNLITVANPERFSLAQAVALHESDQILANGTVAADVSRSYAVNALSSGRVVDVKARLGGRSRVPAFVRLFLTVVSHVSCVRGEPMRTLERARF